MAENFGIFIGVPLRNDGSLRTLARTLVRTSYRRLFTSVDEDRLEVPAGLDIERVDGMPRLDEAEVRAQLLALGADLPEGEDEGSWSHGLVAYDFLLCRGADAQLRMVDGTMYYGPPTGVRGPDARVVFAGLLELAAGVGARLWQTSGGVVPEVLGRVEVDRWVRELDEVEVAAEVDVTSRPEPGRSS